MALADRYNRKFTIEASESKNQLIEKLSERGFTVSDDAIEIKRVTGFFRVFPASGKIKIKLAETEDPGKTKLECEVRPFLFTSNPGIYIFLVFLTILTVLWFKGAFTIPLGIGLFAGWILLTFAAFYLVLLIILLWTVSVLVNSMTIEGAITTLVAWLIAAWIAHLTLRYNRDHLQRYCYAFIRSLTGK